MATSRSCGGFRRLGAKAGARRLTKPDFAGNFGGIEFGLIAGDGSGCSQLKPNVALSDGGAEDTGPADPPAFFAVAGFRLWSNRGAKGEWPASR